MTKFKVGDKFWADRWGKGEVCAVFPDGEAIQTWFPKLGMSVTVPSCWLQLEDLKPLEGDLSDDRHKTGRLPNAYL